ncbi:MAG: arginase [Saprospiraceae bacterium]
MWNRSELGAGTRGSSLGLDALAIAALKKGNTFFYKAPSVTVEINNNALADPINHQCAKRLEYILPVYENVCKQVSQLLEGNRFPLILSGDHSSAGGSVAGVKKAFPDKRVGVIWIDAHADLHSPYTSPSGNVHGMPVATILNKDNKAQANNQLDEATTALWEKLKRVGGIAPKALPEDVVFIAVRDTEKEEDHLIEKYNIKNYKTAAVRSKGVATILQEIKSERLADCDVVYVTFDVDSLDCDVVSHGTGTPVKNGLYPEEAVDFIKGLISWEKVVALEVTEINPLLDEKRNRMAEVAYEVLSDIII